MLHWSLFAKDIHRPNKNKLPQAVHNFIHIYKISPDSALSLFLLQYLTHRLALLQFSNNGSNWESVPARCSLKFALNGRYLRNSVGCLDSVQIPIKAIS